MKYKLSFKEFSVNRTIETILFFAIPILVLVTWQKLSDGGLINRSILSSPKRVYESFYSYAQKGLLIRHLSISFQRVFLGFGIGAGCGLVFGILAGIFPKFRASTTAIFSILRPIPMVGLAPLFILWFGIGELSKILVIAFGSLWPVLLNIETGLQSVDKKHLEVARILKKSKWIVLTRITLPSSIPYLLTGLRLGLSNGWRGIVAAELIGASRGVGYLISYSRELSQPAVMFMGLFIIGFFGIIIDVVLKRLQTGLLKWA